MGIRKYKPTSPGRRLASVSDFADITRAEPEKSLLKPLKKTGGRNAFIAFSAVAPVSIFARANCRRSRCRDRARRTATGLTPAS